MKTYKMILILCAVILASCKKDYLNEKPSSSLITPAGLTDYQNLLDNSKIMNTTGALPQLSSDEYFITDKASFDALGTQTQKNAYLWNSDIYGGETGILDWNQLYSAVLYANSVLDGIKNIPVSPGNQALWNNVKGEALFYRSYAFYNLAQNFCPVYNEASSATDLGIPLRLSSGIDVTLPRSTLKETYGRIISDLTASAGLLSNDFSLAYRNRPSKAATYALLARIYLAMGNYIDAGISAGKSLSLYSTLIDYNTVSLTSKTPFSYTADETLFFSSQVVAYTTSTGYTTSFTAIGVDPGLIALYDPNDLRLPVFYSKNGLGNYNVKRGYVGGGFYAFTGLSTDETILISAECSARQNDPQSTISMLNKLLLNRYKTGSFVPLAATTAGDALSLVLLERRKELVWRALRWSDLKRLNRDGAGITLSRTLNGTVYTLAPNSPKYVFPIPDDEISLSGIQQNIR
ncbi:MAG: SusD family protein [Mucilaginibacter sp.]|nr:SusD family protein [Mucilaginibacter sp.]